jgi:catechol 2,3-dioxygenase-like lactoylglutathione lyase family enzyme
MRVNGIHHVGLTVGDLDRARWFFEKVLGLPLRDAGDDASPAIDRIVGMTDVQLRYAEYDLGAEQILEVLSYVAPEGTPLTQEVNDPGSAHLALEVDDIAAAYARLLEHGVAVRSEPVTIEDEGWWQGCVACYATGPDGFTVELIQRPR